jgi:hypothetical protein
LDLKSIWIKVVLIPYITDKKDQDKLAKSTSKFLVRVAEVVPKLVLKHMVHLQDLFDSEAPGIRACMIDVVCAIIRLHLAKDDR